MSNYYNKQSAKVAIMNVLIEKGWNIFGYKADESDSMTDYWSPAHWDGVAEKNGFVLLVDQHSTHYSGFEVKKYNYNVKGSSADNYSKIQKLQATLNDAAATENEKEVCKRKIEVLENKEVAKPTYTIEQTYPTFSFANPKSCTWHIEKDGEIIAKGKGLTTVYECNDRELTKVNAEKFVSKIESKINSMDSLVPVQQKVVKKVTKPVQETRQTIQEGDVLSFDYHGHFWKVISVYTRKDGKVCATYELLGRKYQQLKNSQRYYDYMEKLEKNVQEGTVKIHTIQEVEEITYKTVYKKATRQGKKENLLASEEVSATTETTQEAPEQSETNSELTSEIIENSKAEIQTEQTTNEITYQTKTGSKGNGIEISFTAKPDEETRNLMKSNGFRWGGRSRSNIWWAILTDERLEIAKQLAGDKDEIEYNSSEDIKPDYLAQLTEAQQETLSNRLEKENVKPIRLYKSNTGNSILFESINTNLESPESFFFIISEGGVSHGKGYNFEYLHEYTLIHSYDGLEDAPKKTAFTYPEIEINDITDSKYNISQSIIDREHDANWIFRKQKKDYNKEIQGYFTECNEKVLNAISTTDNEYYIFKLKESLQRFKKNYHAQYVKYLTSKGNTVSWAVTGRAGRNMNKYNKDMERQNNIMLELASMPEEFNSIITKYENKIWKDKQNKINNKIKSTNINVEFTTMTKEFVFMGVNMKKRVYINGDYFICKTWGCFRIFNIKTNKEIHSMKTTEKLEDAKRYVAYLVQQDQQKAV